jgi:hypothetical protein
MDRWITDWERGEPDWMPYYTRANAGETLPDGALVSVDGTAGTVTVMAPSACDRVATS